MEKYGKRKYFYRLDLLACILTVFCSDIFDKVDNFALIVSTILVLVVDLGMSFGKVKSGKSPEKSGNLCSKLRRNPLDLQTITFVLK